MRKLQSGTIDHGTVRRHRTRAVWLLGLGLLPGILAGCVLGQFSDGSTLVAEEVAAITPGSTTRAQVTEILGPPDEIVHSNREHDPLFEKVYLYKRSKRRQTVLFLVIFSTFRSDKKWDHVAVFFDEKGVVEHVGTRLDTDKASYGAPW